MMTVHWWKFSSKMYRSIFFQQIKLSTDTQKLNQEIKKITTDQRKFYLKLELIIFLYI